VLGLYWLTAPRKQKPRFRSVCYAATLGLGLAAPWFAYQLVVHQHWFWTEHALLEILGFGTGIPQQSSQENPVLFYTMRMAATDPVLLASALVALPSFVVALRRRSGEATLLACWLAVVIAAVLGWQYRNASYLLPIVPALALLATTYGPLSSRSTAPWMLMLVCAAVVGKGALPAAPFGISFQEGTVQRSSRPLSDYCERRRGNELIVVDPDEDLYAAALPLPKLRYCWMGRRPTDANYAMPFDDMGIAVPASRFNDLAKWEPLYRQHLREWGLDTGEPIATLIEARSVEELASMVQAHPGSDFLLPVKYRPALEGVTPQELVGASNDYFFLLSRNSQPRQTPPAWSCLL
jgi:hypothetical protein